MDSLGCRRIVCGCAEADEQDGNAGTVDNQIAGSAGEGESFTHRLAPCLILVGLGLGQVLAVIMDFVQSTAPPEQTSDVAGFSRSVGYLGSSLGTALAGAVLIGVLIAAGSTLLQQSEVLSTDQKDQLEEALDGSTQAVSNAQIEAELQGVRPQVEQEVVGIYAQARNYGMQATAAVLGVVSLLAFLLAFRLKPATPEDEREVTQVRER